MPTPACSPTTNLTRLMLDSYLGKNISEICPHGFDDAELNHCAHFVCHVMNVSAGSVTCSKMSSERVAGRIGACIRVHELFAACSVVGKYDATLDKLSGGVFVFVTADSAVNLKTKSMTNIPKKHVGIALDGNIWHYSNTEDKVVTATPEAFRKHYKSQVNGLYYGDFSAQSIPSSFGCGR